VVEAGGAASILPAPMPQVLVVEFYGDSLTFGSIAVRGARLPD